MFLSQSKYATEILERANMLKCNPCKTTVDTEKKLRPDGPQSLTQPFIVPHLATLKRVLRYIRGTTDLGLQLYQSSISQLISYTDADWAGCLATRRSTSSYCVFLGDNLLSWSLICTDSAKITRKRSKPDKHGHGNG
ncbi:ribonuclease H-like domain-containing protein [Tanacetum coccineum]